MRFQTQGHSLISFSISWSLSAWISESILSVGRIVYEPASDDIWLSDFFGYQKMIDELSKACEIQPFRKYSDQDDYS
jgi:hypothetical protein